MQIEKILVPVDFSDPSRAALQAAIRIGKAFGARIDLCHVEEVLTYRGVRYEEVLSPGGVEKAREEARTRLAEWLGLAEAEGLEGETLLVEGDARSQILKVAEEKEVDLIVLGAQGHSLLHDLLIGNVARHVSSDARCSVLLVR